MTPLIREAKNVLMNYRRLARLTGCSYSLDEIYRVTEESFMSEATVPQFAGEHCLNCQLAIITAWQSLPSKEQQVIFYTYLGKEPMRMIEIAEKMDYSLKSVEKFKAQGSMRFLSEFKQRYKFSGS